MLCCWLGPVGKEKCSLSSKAEKETEGANSWACQLMAFLHLSGKGDPSCTLCDWTAGIMEIPPDKLRRIPEQKVPLIDFSGEAVPMTRTIE